MDKEKLIAACGLYCGACEMYRAVHDKDEAKIDRLVKAFNAAGFKVTREDIECDGCLAGGRLTPWCKECTMKNCPEHKNDNGICSPECKDFPCKTLSDFSRERWTHHHETVDNLRRLHEMGLTKHAEEEGKRWLCPQCHKSVTWFERACASCGALRSEKLFKLDYDWPPK